MAEWRGLWECAAGHRWANAHGPGVCGIHHWLHGEPEQICTLPVHRLELRKEERRQGEPWAQLARMREALSLACDWLDSFDATDEEGRPVTEGMRELAQTEEVQSG